MVRWSWGRQRRGQLAWSRQRRMIEEKLPDNFNEPLDVAPHDENFCWLSNRRPTVLMMYAAVYGDRGTPAVWKICNSDTDKLED